MVREMVVVPYSSNWSELYKEAEKTLRGVLGKFIFNIQHFASTW